MPHLTAQRARVHSRGDDSRATHQLTTTAATDRVAPAGREWRDSQRAMRAARADTEEGMACTNELMSHRARCITSYAHIRSDASLLTQ